MAPDKTVLSLLWWLMTHSFEVGKLLFQILKSELSNLKNGIEAINQSMKYTCFVCDTKCALPTGTAVQKLNRNVVEILRCWYLRVQHASKKVSRILFFFRKTWTWKNKKISFVAFFKTSCLFSLCWVRWFILWSRCLYKEQNIDYYSLASTLLGFTSCSI